MINNAKINKKERADHFSHNTPQ